MMNAAASDGIDYASEDLGLAPLVDSDEEGDNFDAFNEDTFGAEDVWHEDDHEELAKFTEEERRGHQEDGGDGFFDFDNGPMEALEEDHHQRPQNGGRHASPLLQHQHQHDLAALAHDLQHKIQLERANAAAAAAHHSLPLSDPAVLNVGKFPPIPHPFMQGGMPPQVPAGFPGLPPQFARPPNNFPPMPTGLNDPAIMSMGAIPPQLLQQMQLQQQQLQQQQQHQPPRPLHPMMMPPPAVAMPPNRQPKTLEEIEQELLSDQRHHDARREREREREHQQQQRQQQQMMHHHHMQQQQQQQRQQQQQMMRNYQQHFHQQQQQQQQYRQQGKGPFNSNHHQQQPQQYHHQQQQRNRNPFDDRNNETFGDDFVQHHFGNQQHQDQRHRLITPGHVHVLGILRGARARGGGGGSGAGGNGGLLTESTGNPRLDLELQRRAAAASANFNNGGGRNEGEDEYAGLMSDRDRQWIRNIQLSQLKCENPFVDDYYFTVFKLRKQHQQQYISAANNHNTTSMDDGDEFGDNLENMPPRSQQPKPEEEGAHLLLPSDTSRMEYMPQQYSNSLGKLQAATVKAPRKIIDVGSLNADVSENAAQKDSKNFKMTLLELEHLYNLLIEVEDCEKKLLALPTNTTMRTQVEEERCEAVKKFGARLTGENRLKAYLMVRKGKTLMKRGLRLLDDLQMGLVCTHLLQHYHSILRKDREEQLLSEFWNSGLQRHLLSAPVELIQHYLNLMSVPNYSLKSLVATSLGASIVTAIVHRASVFISRNTIAGDANLTEAISNLCGKLADCPDVSTPLPFSFRPQLLDAGQLGEGQYQQLQRLVVH